MVHFRDGERPVTRYLLFTLLVLLLGVAALHPENWNVKVGRQTFSDPGTVKIPAEVLVLGDLQILYPSGGWPAVRSQNHPVLQVEGWQAANDRDVSIVRTTLLLDGKPVEPVSVHAVPRPDIAHMYDRIDFFGSGWHVGLPLEHLGPDPHFLSLQVTLSTGQVIEIRRVVLQ